jgi:predicted nucleotidyltransferase
LVTPVRPDLIDLARILADWADECSGIDALYLFGSRVRGDHRPDSDVDVRLYLHRWQVDAGTLEWWGKENTEDFARLKARLPGRLSLHADQTDAVDPEISRGALAPVYVDRKVVCVCTGKRSG